MATIHFPPPRTQRLSPGDPTTAAPRAAQRGGTYAPFIPQSIAERPFSLGSEATSAIGEAARALARLRELAPRLASPAALARNVLRAESMASSRIEGLRISARRLARAAHAAKRGLAGDPRAVEVLGNVEAIEQAIEIGARSPAFTAADLKRIHLALLRLTEDGDSAGVLRGERDWIGADDYNPVGADYVPPPPEKVRDSLRDLCAFIERGDLAPTAQAAIAHAQFKNIHPFAVGSGRTGRALIFTVLRRRGETAGLIPPISPVLASRPKAYVSGLGAYSVGNFEAWCETFAGALTRAVGEAEWIADALEARETEWLERLGNPRADSAVRQILRELPGHPVIDAGLAASLTRKSHTAVHKALNGLEQAGVLRPLGKSSWGRAWEAVELLEPAAELDERASAAPD